MQLGKYETSRINWYKSAFKHGPFKTSFSDDVPLYFALVLKTILNFVVDLSSLKLPYAVNKQLHLQCLHI